MWIQVCEANNKLFKEKGKKKRERKSSEPPPEFKGNEDRIKGKYIK